MPATNLLGSMGRLVKHSDRDCCGRGRNILGCISTLVWMLSTMGELQNGEIDMSWPKYLINWEPYSLMPVQMTQLLYCIPNTWSGLNLSRCKFWLHSFPHCIPTLHSDHAVIIFHPSDWPWRGFHPEIFTGCHAISVWFYGYFSIWFQ